MIDAATPVTAASIAPSVYHGLAARGNRVHAVLAAHGADVRARIQIATSSGNFHAIDHTQSTPRRLQTGQTPVDG